MAKYELRIKARQLRSRGESVKQIARELGISKSTCSLWVRDIVLSIKQLEKIKQRIIKGSERGRIKGAFVQKQRRLRVIEEWRRRGIEDLRNLKEQELFVAGIALYWAEGAKNKRTVQFFNSDHRMINFIILWLKTFFGVETNEIRARVGVNEAHEEREKEIREYWSKITGIPLNQFTRTSLKKVKSKKVYENFNEHFGTLAISILKPARIYYKIMGLIDGLSEAGQVRIGRE